MIYIESEQIITKLKDRKLNHNFLKLNDQNKNIFKIKSHLSYLFYIF